LESEERWASVKDRNQGPDYGGFGVGSQICERLNTLDGGFESGKVRQGIRVGAIVMIVVSEVRMARIVKRHTVTHFNMVVRRDFLGCFLDGMEHLEGRKHAEGQHSRQDQQDNGLSLYDAGHDYI
jgi:hypothetical protein